MLTRFGWLTNVTMLLGEWDVEIGLQARREAESTILLPKNDGQPLLERARPSFLCSLSVRSFLL